eukprot:gene30739-40029_t
MGGRVLDATLAVSLIGRETPHELLADRNEINFIRLIDNRDSDRNKEKVAAIRKINLSFNPLQQPRALDGLDQAIHPECLNCLSSLNKLEILFLQQNFISTVPESFRSLNKLVELRLDRNKITKIENLQSCSSLKILDLSSNQIQSLDGISGLQSLQELKASGNCIENLSPCRALPSIKEIDLSNNRLTSLEGLQQLPTLQYFKADHNYITSLIYTVHQTSNSTKKKGMDSKDSHSSSFSSNKGVTNSNKDNHKKGAASTLAQDKSGDNLPKRAESGISELSLSGNKLKSLEGIEIFSKSLEVLDISFNFINNTTNNSSLLPYISKMKQLAEVRVNGNPVCGDESAHSKLSAEICSACPTIRAASKTVDTANDKSEAKVTKSDSSVISHDFHTWEKGGEESTVSVSASLVEDLVDDDHDDDEDASFKEKGKPNVGPEKVEAPKAHSRSYYQSDSESEADEAEAAPGNNPNQQKKSAPAIDGEYDPKFASAEDARIAAPRLTLQSLKTPEEIMEMESKFTDLVKECKQILESTVFAFAGDIHEQDSTKISAMLAEQQEEEHERRASYLRSLQEKEVDITPPRNSGSILERQLQDIMDRPASKDEEAKGEEQLVMPTLESKDDSKDSYPIEEKEVPVPIIEMAVADEKQETNPPAVFAEKPSVSPSRKSNPPRKAPAPVNAAFNSSILASGVTRHGTKIQTQSQGKVKVVASEDGLMLLSPSKDGISSSIASQLENVKIMKREPKVFLNSKVVTFPDMSISKSPDPVPSVSKVGAAEEEENDGSRMSNSVQELRGLKRFACATNIDPRWSNNRETIGNQSDEGEGIPSSVTAAAIEVYDQSQYIPSNPSQINDSDDEASDDGSVVSILQEAADAIRGNFNPHSQSRSRDKSSHSSAHLFDISEGSANDDDDEGGQGGGESNTGGEEEDDDDDYDGMEEQENQENQSVIKVINQISLAGGAVKKPLPTGSASVVQVMNSPRLLAERQTLGIAVGTGLGGGRKYSTMKFKIPQGAQSAIRGSLDAGSLTSPSPLHSSDDSDIKSTHFRQVNSAPDLK